MHVWPEPPPGPLAEAARQTFAAGEGLAGRVWFRDRPMWITAIAAEAADDPIWAAALADGYRWACGFPIRNGIERLGVLQFLSRGPQATDAEVQRMLANIGSQVSQFIERRDAEAALRDQAEERRLAREIQRDFLPREMPVVPGYTIAAASVPAEAVGGDYFDFLKLPSGRLGIVIGDASGHGLAAALLMGLTRTSLRTAVMVSDDLAAAMSLANRRMAEDTAVERFITVFFAQLDPLSRTLYYSSAGHWSGYVLAADGSVRVTLTSTGPPLGIDFDATFPAATPVVLQAGETVLLLTDGVLEAFNGEEAVFGVAGTLAVTRAHLGSPPSALVEALFQAVATFSGQSTPKDDMTALVMRVE